MVIGAHTPITDWDLDPDEACEVVLGSPIPAPGSRVAAKLAHDDMVQRLTDWACGTLKEVDESDGKSNVKPWFNVANAGVLDKALKLSYVQRYAESVANYKLFNLLYSKQSFRDEMIDEDGRAKIDIPEGTEFMVAGTVHSDMDHKEHSQFSLPVLVAEAAQRQKAAAIDDKRERKRAAATADGDGGAKKARKATVQVLKVATVVTPGNPGRLSRVTHYRIC